MASSEFKQAFARQGDPDFQAFHHDLYRSVGKGRWWVMEQQPGPVNWAPYNRRLYRVWSDCGLGKLLLMELKLFATLDSGRHRLLRANACGPFASGQCRRSGFG